MNVSLAFFRCKACTIIDTAPTASHTSDWVVTATSRLAAFTTVSAAPRMSKLAGCGCSLGNNRSSTGSTISTRQVMPNNPFQPKYWLMTPPTIGPKPKAIALPAEIIAIAAPRLSIGT
ncbi:hypothetical protein D3C71_1615580 [compost metagenome]